MYSAGKLTGISGHFAGNVFSLRDGCEITIGRSAETADVVYGSYDNTISRSHCTVSYDGKSDTYIVTDHSTKGTYSAEGIRFPLEQKVKAAPGTLLVFGRNRSEIFRVG